MVVLQTLGVLALVLQGTSVGVTLGTLETASHAHQSMLALWRVLAIAVSTLCARVTPSCFLVRRLVHATPVSAGVVKHASLSTRAGTRAATVMQLPSVLQLVRAQMTALVFLGSQATANIVNRSTTAPLALVYTVVTLMQSVK